MSGLESLQWYDYMRLATAVLTVWIAWRLAMVTRHRTSLGQTYSSRLKDFLWMFYAYLFTQHIGAIETTLQDAPYRWGAVLSFIICLVAIRATRKTDEPLIT